MNNPASIAQLGLTDDEIEAIALKHVAPGAKTLREIVPGLAPYQQSWQFQRIKAFLVDALAARRAPVADERAAVDPCGYVAVKVSAVDWLKDKFPALTIKAGLCERIGGRLNTITRLMRDHDAALASASVAGETQAAIILNAVDEDGPLLGWTKHWVEYPIGTKFYAAPQANAEPLVRYCPGCGSVGPVESEYRDCCPDGGEARMVPAPLAEKCRDTFKIAVKALRADAAANEAMANQVPAVTEEYTLRAMARNYTDRHSWDKLDSKAITAAADEIRALRAALAARAQLPERGDAHD